MIRLAGAAFFTHAAVACFAWINGYLARVHLERRNRELDLLFEASPDFDLVDLVDVQPYDWAVDDSGLSGPTEGVFEWPRGVIVRRPYPPVTP